MKKCFTCLYWVGALGFITYFVLSLALSGSIHGFKYAEWLRLMLYCSFSLFLPLWGYKLYHYREYRRENRNRLMAAAVMALIGIAFFLFRG